MWLLRLDLKTDGREFTTLKTRISIGRNPECDVAFPEIKVISRKHVEIFLREGAWYLADCNARNGTWVNRNRLSAGETVLLFPGDVIDLAHSQTIVFLEGKALEQSTPAPAVRPPVAAAKPAEPARVCPICGAESPGLFCRYCGALIGDAPIPDGMKAPYASMAPAPMASAPAPMPSPTAAESSVPKKKGLFSKIGDLFGGKKAEAPAPAPGPVTADDVQFRGTAPETIHPGEYFPVKIMMYREDDYQRADRESAAVADKTKSASSSVFQAAVGQQFRIALQSPDIELDCEPQQLRWNGKFAAADFEVYLPEEYDRRQLRLRGRVYSDNAVLTDLKLILQIGAVQPQTVACEKVCLRSAFISYASADRAKVVARIQGIQLARPDMELFFDVESLRRGENWEPRLYREISGRDLFYLFWSKNAADSQWVQKELEYAVTQKTVDYIEPIPLEGPEVCPPPQSLMCKHFNDWTLRYLNNQ